MRPKKLQLQRGDLLCLMTDGVGEAMTAASGALLGTERVKAILAGRSGRPRAPEQPRMTFMRA